MAPPTPVRVKEVVYSISPYQQSIMSGLFKDLSHKMAHRVKGYGKDAFLFLILPVYGTMWFCENFREKEKLHHRY